MAGVQLIQHQDAASAIKAGKAANLRVIGDASGWHFTFDLPDPSTGLMQTFRTKTSRGNAKNWSQASTLIRHLSQSFGVLEGSWQLNHGESKNYVDQ